MAFSTPSFSVSTKAFQRSAFLYTRASSRRGAHAVGAPATIFFQASMPLSTDCCSASQRRRGLVYAARMESRSSTPLPFDAECLIGLLALPVALALALLGLVIHCAPPDSDPCRCLPLTRG